MITDIISVAHVFKTYSSGFSALQDINLTIKESEIFALLGPNGAGKSTLINLICGIVNPTSGTVTARGHDIVKDYRKARSLIGLVPQELTTDMFETVLNTVKFSRNLFGHKDDPVLIEKILRALSLWEKRNSKIMTLSGGMKRRVMIAKALSHEPKILFLDEPSAGVDVELRHDMWEMVKRLRETGVTIILTTHYIEEAEEMADRVGVINKGKIVLVEEKKHLMKKLGKKQLILTLTRAITEDFTDLPIEITENGTKVTYTFDSKNDESGVTTVIKRLADSGLSFKDLRTKESSLEDIFVQLVEGNHERL
jgi:ABC-2 type transport system ATP-binding protein